LADRPPFCEWQLNDFALVRPCDDHPRLGGGCLTLHCRLKGIVLAANIFGKLKTVFQMVAIPLVLLNGWPFSYFDLSWDPALRIASFFVYAATLASFLSGMIYFIQNRKVFQEASK
jgi:phosphatidylglycerophosphate synthase